VHTILYYERRGLLPKGRRTSSGYRLFSMDAVLRIAFIKRSKQLGFTLKEIRDIIALRVPGATCDGVHERLLAKVDDIDARLRTLRSARKQLLSLAAECTDGRPLSECAVMRRLERAGATPGAADGRRTG
jgi:DNA-binding transcriptional MerR regulator